jgi:hypothetical protein
MHNLEDVFQFRKLSLERLMTNAFKRSLQILLWCIMKYTDVHVSWLPHLSATLTATPTLKTWLKWSDTAVGLLCVGFRILSELLMAFATNSFMLYASKLRAGNAQHVWTTHQKCFRELVPSAKVKRHDKISIYDSELKIPNFRFKVAH